MVNYVPSGLCLLLTTDCNSNCKFCGIERSKDYMEESMMIKAIDQTEELDEIEYVSFSGGEVSLKKETLLKGISHAKSKGLRTRMVTNGSYGSNAEICDSFTKNLKDVGLDRICYSVDLEHQRHVKYEDILRAIKNGLNEDISVGIQTTYYKSGVEGTRAILEGLARQLNGELVENQEFFIDMGKKKIDISESLMAYSASAKKLRKDEAIFSKINIGDMCRAETLTIKPNGNAMPSSQFHALSNPFYCVGNVNENTLKDAVINTNNSIVDLMLSPYSFVRLRNFFRKSKDPKIRKFPNKKFNSICDFCSKMSSNPKIIDPVLEEYDKFKGSNPEIIFEWGPERGKGKDMVSVDGKEMLFLEYLGHLSRKDFFTKLGNEGVKSLEGNKKNWAKNQRLYYKIFQEWGSALKKSKY